MSLLRREFTELFKSHSATFTTCRGLRSITEQLCLNRLIVCFEEFLVISKYLISIAIDHSLCRSIRKGFIVAHSKELRLMTCDKFFLLHISHSLTKSSKFLIVCLFLLLLFGQKGIVFLTPIGCFGISLRCGVFVLLNLSREVIVLVGFKSRHFFFGGHFCVTLNFADINLCHLKYLLRLTRQFTLHYFSVFGRVVSRLRLVGSLLYIKPYGYIPKEKGTTSLLSS